jgi:hypothetical protein
LIGNNYYFQTIEETIPKDGSDPMVELITRDDQGVIINKKIFGNGQNWKILLK